MAFEKTAAELKRLIQRVLREDGQIRNALPKAGLEDGEVEDKLASQLDAIWEAAASELRLHAQQQRNVADITSQVLQAAGPRPADGKLPSSTLTDSLTAALGLSVLGLLVWLGVKLWRGWASPLLWTAGNWVYFSAAVLVPVAVALWLRLLSARHLRLVSTQRDADGRLMNEWQQRAEALATQQGLGVAQASLATLVQTIEARLFERVRQALRSEINRRLEPSYEPVLALERPRGFGEVFDKRLTIGTPARDKLQFMLESMPGGTIGIAGSRGAGKTTLIKLFCGPKRVVDKINGKPVLGVLVSAPVAYQAREFVLYLFSAVCQQVIDPSGGKFAFAVPITDAPPPRFIDSPLFATLRPFPSLFVLAGLWLVLLSWAIALVIAVAAVEDTRRAATAARPPAAAASTAAVAAAPPLRTAAASALAPPRVSAASASASASASSSTAATPFAVAAAAPPSAPATGSADAVARAWFAQFKIDAGALLSWGLLLMAAGLAVAELIGFGAARTLLVALVRLLHQLIGWLPVYGRLTRGMLQTQLDKAADEARQGDAPRAGSGVQPAQELPTPAAATAPANDLRAQAESWLRSIKFQQSYTSGWSGAMKLPIGLEGGVNRAVTLAQIQMSLPEVVYFLTEFLERIAREYQVVIGIDEMDKLADDELARQFLNDIKSVFGLERCFYLVSVSEDAISNFERRGLPFRDVFDSAFDDFVYVDHLRFSGARELLEQRVVGRPVPFFALSYCMSGGLARDLIRSFRAVLEVHRREPQRNSLEQVAGTVIEADLRAKLRALRTATRKLTRNAHTDRFLHTLHRIEQQIAVDADLATEAHGLLQAVALPPQPSPSPPSPSPSPADVCAAALALLAARLPGRADADQPLPSPGPAPLALPWWCRPASADAVPPGAPAAAEPGPGASAAAAGQPPDEAAVKLNALAEELGTYLCYAVTLRQFFSNRLSRDMIETPPAQGSLDDMAKVRQLIGMTPAIARSMLAAFRQAQQLPLLPWLV